MYYLPGICTRGHAVQTVIDELRRYAVGWMNYFGISRTYREVLELDDWIRRRVRLYHWTALPRLEANRRARRGKVETAHPQAQPHQTGIESRARFTWQPEAAKGIGA
jgi:hypothetical protein